MSTIDLTGISNLKDLSATQQVEFIKKTFDVVNKGKAFWGQFADSQSLENEKGTNRWTVHRQIITENVRNQVLKEGALAVNLTPDKLRVVAFTVTTQSYYRYLPLTAKLLKNSYNNTFNMAANQLADGNLRDREALIGSMMVSGGCVYIPGAGVTTYKPIFLHNKMQLAKNGAQPIDGFYNAIVSIEAAAEIAAEAGEEFVNNEKNAIVRTGEVGKVWGFRLITAPANDEFIYHKVEDYDTYSTSSTYAVGDRVKYRASDSAPWKVYENKTAINAGESFTSSKWTDLGTDPVSAYMLFFGTGMLGKPVVKTNVGGSGDAKIVWLPPKASHEDPLSQRATMASEVDDVGIYMQHDECLIRVEKDITFVESDIGTTQAEIEAFYYSNRDRNGFDNSKSEGTPNPGRTNETMP